MDAGELLLKAHELGLRILSDGDALVIPAGFPATLRADVLRLRTTLAPLLSLEVGQLCHGMTADEREAFEERAGLGDGGVDA